MVAKEEEENFLQEISRFNSDFSLKANRETVFKSQTHTVLLDLEKEVESIHKGCKTLYCSVFREDRGYMKQMWPWMLL